MWNHFGTQSPRTTNNIEGCHSKLKKMTQHSYPDLFTAIQMFKDIQNANDIALIQRAVGGKTRPRAKRYQTIDRRLSILKERYETCVLELMAYACSASQCVRVIIIDMLFSNIT